ncbi:diphosphomevalonate decarboxylase isoform X2 [Halyomorpha halys]|nr:diphosphomevalonate decarboxylase isoform X2 [Halyomorpha halys]
MHAKTTVMISPNFEKDRLWLNGKEESCTSPRVQACLKEIRRRASQTQKGKKNNQGIDLWKVHICSENNFPTAAGLASSAAGYACLVTAVAKAYKVEGDYTTIARLGSGSACRSVLGGFVRWHKGDQGDGSDSFASQILPASHWPTIRILILVVSDSRKKISSSYGMQRSVETSELLKHRATHIVPQRTEQIIKAIKNHDFETFAELTMKDSNQLHSVCLDTYPPAVYMNDVSHTIVEFVHSYNKIKGTTKLAYTFDAGPNACLFLQEEDVAEVVAAVKQVFPPTDENNYIRGINVPEKTLDKDLVLPSGPQEAGSLRYIIHTKIGEGPSEINNPEGHLLDQNGLPKPKTGWI